MAWACTGSSNGELVANLVRHKLVNHELAVEAMKAVDRALFVVPQLQSVAYDDRPLPIGYDVTISAPHMHAMMLDLMAPHLGEGTSALDIGSGSGYIVACMAKMGAAAYGIEHIQPLIPRSIEAVKKAIGDAKFEIKHGDGRLGWPEHAPYDVIHVGAAAEPRVVDTLMKQLKPNGVLIIPLELGYSGQSLFEYSFGQDSKVIKRHICDVRFVPLCDAPTSYDEGL